mmetsp:Transcript_55314/g.128768  ORF Transcript_55314/g.128768 Transcript_55314/m.128768 type:complete len:206 (+) Transcript_55314:384-1001(+)
MGRGLLCVELCGLLRHDHLHPAGWLDHRWHLARERRPRAPCLVDTWHRVHDVREPLLAPGQRILRRLGCVGGCLPLRCAVRGVSQAQDSGSRRQRQGDGSAFLGVRSAGRAGRRGPHLSSCGWLAHLGVRLRSRQQPLVRRNWGVLADDARALPLDSLVLLPLVVLRGPCADLPLALRTHGQRLLCVLGCMVRQWSIGCEAVPAD